MTTTIANLCMLVACALPIVSAAALSAFAIWRAPSRSCCKR